MGTGPAGDRTGRTPHGSAGRRWFSRRRCCSTPSRSIRMAPRGADGADRGLGADPVQGGAELGSGVRVAVVPARRGDRDAAMAAHPVRAAGRQHRRAGDARPRSHPQCRSQGRLRSCRCRRSRRMAWIAYFIAMYGAPDPAIPYRGSDLGSPAYITGGLGGIFFDQMYGLLAHAPALIAAPIGLGVLAWRRGPYRLLSAQIAFIVAAVRADGDALCDVVGRLQLSGAVHGAAPPDAGGAGGGGLGGGPDPRGANLADRRAADHGLPVGGAGVRRARPACLFRSRRGVRGVARVGQPVRGSGARATGLFRAGPAAAARRAVFRGGSDLGRSRCRGLPGGARVRATRPPDRDPDRWRRGWAGQRLLLQWRP